MTEDCEASPRASGEAAGGAPSTAATPMRPVSARLRALVVVNAVTGTVCVLAGLSLAFDSGGASGAVAAGVVCATVGLVAGQAAFLLHRRCRGGRLVQIGLAVIGLPLFPFWTAASAWTLVTMFRRGERTLLSGKREEEWTPEEAAAVRALPPPSRRRTASLAIGLLLLLGLEAVVLIALPDFGSIEGAKQKRTMSDLRSAMTAVEAYAAREGAYPSSAPMDDLAKELEPALVARLPRADAWGHPIRYESWKANDASAGPDSYLLASPGEDGAWQVDPRTVAPGPTRGTKADLVIRDGEFVSYPEGTAPSSAR
mgnify:CR=1 FL=1